MVNCTAEVCSLLGIYYAASAISVVMCMVAIVVMIYYKLYRSFNFRLTLYLFISLLINTLIPMIVFALELFLDTTDSIVDYLDSLFWYPVWTIQLCIGFMTAVIFFAVIFSVELRKAEIPSTIACFTLPLVELVGIKFHEQTEQFSKYNVILGMVVASICFIATAIVLIYNVYMRQCLRRHAISNNNEEQHLLHAEPTRQRYTYRNAQKEILPFIVYPAMILLWLLMYYIFVSNAPPRSTDNTLEAYNVLDASAGTLSSILFFVLVRIHIQHRRNALRSGSDNTESSHDLRETNEGQKIMVAEGVTATHVTHFDPLGDSDVEP